MASVQAEKDENCHRYDNFHHWTSSSKGTNKIWIKRKDTASVSLFKPRAETMKRSMLGEKLKELWDGRGREEGLRRGKEAAYRLVTKLGFYCYCLVDFAFGLSFLSNKIYWLSVTETEGTHGIMFIFYNWQKLVKWRVLNYTAKAAATQNRCRHSQPCEIKSTNII